MWHGENNYLEAGRVVVVVAVFAGWIGWAAAGSVFDGK
jgi:hypothetical protein